MRTDYHYLVAGLPDLLFDDSKLQLDLNRFREVLTEILDESDMEFIRTYFYRYDNQNILARLKDPACDIYHYGNMSPEKLELLFSAVKEGSFDTDITGVPRYIGEFLSAYMNETPVYEGKSWDLQLSELYYDYAGSSENGFIRDWFNYEKDISNLVTASQCRKYNLATENQLIGSDQLVEKLARSNARDFGLDNEFPFLDELLKAIEETDLKEFEKKIDRIKWDYLDDRVFFFYFTIERVFSYLIKVAIIERWLSLDKETGQKLFNELVSNLESSYEFPEEFKLKK